jgi:hypothetical protein
MEKKTEQHGCIFYHLETDKPCLWVTEYNEKWKEKEDPNLFRIRCEDDIPAILPFDLTNTSFANYFLYKHKAGDKRGLYFYLSAFFTDKKEQEDFWLFFLESGFPAKELSHV